MENEAKKRRGNKRSSSSHGSVEPATAATCRPTTTSTTCYVSSALPACKFTKVQTMAQTREEAAVLASVTVLASELRPEHKLPSRDILVQPKPKFMDLLETVGAKGTVFTARQVLSYLIKYITNRQLYVQQDPKRVYCGKDPLGEVFGIETFTIKDAKKLLFDNMSVLREAPDFASQHNDSFQREQRKMYYTFHQAQQTTDVSRPISVPTRSATTPSLHPVPIATLCQVASDRKSSSVKRKEGPEKYDSTVYQGKVVDDGASSSNFVNYAVSESAVSSSREAMPASSVVPLTVVDTVTGQPSAAEMPKNTSMHSASITEQPSLRNTPFGRGTKRKRSRLTSESSEDCTQRSTCQDAPDSDRRTSRPWYCMHYHPSEDLKSLDSEVLSIQDCETAIIADSSDDLWFVDEDEETPVEYDVPSDSSDDYTINKSSCDDSSDSIEAIEHVYDVVVEREHYVNLREDFSYLGDNSDEETTDTEISDLDKWECMECSTRNLPFKRYCCRCWALRNEWLPDNQRMTLKERLFNRPLRRSFSAPAGNVNPPTPSCQTQPSGIEREIKPIPTSSTEAVSLVTGTLIQTQRSVRDFSDGLQHASPTDFPDMPEGKNSGEDEAGTGVESSDDQCASKRPHIISDEQGENSQDTIIVTGDSQAPSGTTDLEDQTEGELEYPQPDSQKREDSGIGLTQDSSRTNKKRKQETQTTSRKSYTPRKRQRSASGSDLPVQSGLALAGLKMSKLSDPSVLQVRMGVPVYSALAEKNDPGAGPSSKPSGVVTEHYNDLCIICYSRPKTASIIHGRSGHQVCCYPCAKKLHHRGKPCPVCRRPIQAVIKNFLL